MLPSSSEQRPQVVADDGRCRWSTMPTSDTGRFRSACDPAFGAVGGEVLLCDVLTPDGEKRSPSDVGDRR